MYRLNPSVADQIIDANEQFAAGALDTDEFQFLVAEAVTRAPSEQAAMQAVFPFADRIARTLYLPVERTPVKTAQSIVKLLRAKAAPPPSPSVEFVSLSEKLDPAYEQQANDVREQYAEGLITAEEAKNAIEDLKARSARDLKRQQREQRIREEREASASRQERERAERDAFFEAQKAAGKAEVFDVEYEETAPVDVFKGQISEDDLFIVQNWMRIQEAERANDEAEQLFENDPVNLAKVEERREITQAASDAFFKILVAMGVSQQELAQTELRVWKALQAAALRMARRELRGRRDIANSAVELATEAAIQAYMKLHHYKGRGRQAEAFSRIGKAKVSTWVGSIVRNLARTLRERQSASTVAGRSGLTALAESLGFSGVARSMTVRVQPDDTIESIALRFYGTPTKAKSIRQKNNIPAGGQPAVGTEITLTNVPEKGVRRVTGEAADIAMMEAEDSPWAGTYGDIMQERMLSERLASEQEVEEMGRREDQIVWEALQTLPKDDRYILLARMPKGTYNLPDGTVHAQTESNDYAYIAQVLGIPKGTVMSRLSRARNKVFEALGDKIKPPYFGELSKGILQLAANGRQGKVDAGGHVDTLAPLPAVAVQAPELVPVLATPNWPEWLVDLLRPSKEQLQAGWREKLSGVGPQPRKTGMLPGVSGFVGRGEERVGFYQRDPSRRRANPYVPGTESADFYYETPMDLLFMWQDGLITQEQYDTCMAAIDTELAAMAA